MHYTKQDISKMTHVDRLKLINSVSGIKPANLIATISNKGITNVAVFSSVIHLGSNPALLGFVVRPTKDICRDTYNNIKENYCYTINHIMPQFTEKAHYTSAKFDQNISEFDICNLTEEYIMGFKAPFVKESTFKIGMRFREAIDITLNNTILIIGEIEHISLPDISFADKDVDLEQTKSVGISGLNSYYELKKIATYPYARVNEVPDF